MKRILLLLITIATFATTTVLAQGGPKPKAKSTGKTAVKATPKPKPTAAPVEEDVLMSMDFKTDEGVYQYDVKKGDQFVYRVNAGGSEYDFIVTINKFNSKDGIDFNYEMTNANNTKGHVTISKEGKGDARNYINYFRGGELNLKDACTVWLSYATFSDMPKKQTELSFDGGEKITMYRPEKDDAEQNIVLKGQDRTIETFKINSAADGTGDKTLWIHNNSSNPLIMKMNLGFTIELKEIR